MTAADLAARVSALEAERDRLREALAEIRECMGGDECDGWHGPEDVWGIATAALAPAPVAEPSP